MKKFLCLILSITVIFNCFAIFSFAEGTSITTADPISRSITLAVCQSRQIFINVSPESAKKAGLKDFYYQVSYSQNAKSKNAEYAEFPASSRSTEISDLKANTRYYVCIRTVKKYGSIKIYGSWSAQKSVKTKA